MTEWGIDVAKYQAGLGLAGVKAEGFSWVEARASTGWQGGTVDPQFATFKTQARQVGLPLVAYHFLYSASVVPIARQAQVCAAAIDDKSIPVMIDHETADGTAQPTVADAVAFQHAMWALGYRVPLWYLPRWVWTRLGSPALPKNTGMTLVASSYVSGTGYASTLYPGDQSPLWAPYGGLEPAILQFTDKAQVETQQVDADAFRGSLAQLEALLAGGAAPKPTPAPVPPPKPAPVADAKLPASQPMTVAMFVAAQRAMLLGEQSGPWTHTNYPGLVRAGGVWGRLSVLFGRVARVFRRLGIK